MGPRVIIGIPGVWPSRADLVQALLDANGLDYVMAGSVCLERASGISASVELYDRDPRLVQAFTAAGQGRIGEETLARIGQHAMTAYVLVPAAIPDAALAAARFAVAFLKAGGLAVKVESAGIAHEKEHWLAVVAKASAPADLHDLLVVLVGGQERYYSCGMHNFCLPDTSVSAALPMAAAADLLRTFNFFQLVDQPTLKPGETFSAARDAPRFRLSQRPFEGYDADDPLCNQFGLWHLEPIG
jgi:hypothetical protein